MTNSEWALLVLRIGLGVTFLLTGYFILTEKDHWTGMILPRAEKFIIGSKQTTMKMVGFYDLFNGIWLISGLFTWIAALFAALHMLQVFFAAGINNVTYRDIGIFAASLALMIATLPHGLL